MKKHNNRTMLRHGERLRWTQGRGMCAGSSVKRDSGLQLLGLIQSRPPLPPILLARASSKPAFTHTLPSSAPSCCQVCSVFPASAGRNLGQGPS